MTVKEAMEHLKTMNEEHVLRIRVTYDCGCAVTESSVDNIEYRTDGSCVLSGEEF